MRFKKVIAAVVLAVAFFPAYMPVHGQYAAYEKGAILFDGGFALWPIILHAHLDIGVHDLVSAGGGLGVHMPTPSRGIAIPILARGAFHPFNLPVLQDKIAIRDRFDAYAGLIAGIAIDPDDGRAPVLPTFGEFIGCRFYISDQFGFYAEHEAAGPGEHLGWIGGGVTLKF